MFALEVEDCLAQFHRQSVVLRDLGWWFEAREAMLRKPRDVAVDGAGGRTGRRRPLDGWLPEEYDRTDQFIGPLTRAVHQEFELLPVICRLDAVAFR